MNARGEASGRVLALDVGLRRTGIAMSDPLRRLASPLETVSLGPRALVAHILDLVKQHEITLIVLGHPELRGGLVSAPSQLVSALAAKLRAASDIPVIFWDETLTTWEAEAVLRQPGRKRARSAAGSASAMRRRRAAHKAEIDRVAAAVILQDFLDTQRHRAGSTPPEDER